MTTPLFKSLATASACAVAAGAATWAGALLGITVAEAVWPTAIACGLVGWLAQSAKQALGGMVDNRTATLRRRLENLQRDVGDIHGLVRLQPYTQRLPLPMGGGWALTGDSAAILVREALLRRPRSVLELGSGVSTLLLGQVLKDAGGGRLLSIDHDPVWAERTRRQVELLGLNDVVTVLDAPLKSVEVDGRHYDWYDIAADRLASLGPVDLLMIDGPPPASHQPLGARYPALPLLRSCLAPDSLVFVDDAKRATVSATIDRWLAADSGWSAQRFDTVDGVCLLFRADEPARSGASP
ncbi:MAG: class I SAM-dependent methyltransferase [Burkholderiaceae bacterium]|nr:class I SAM-dependent methyltransferase [Burkholderiaceae bacterium]